MGPQASSGAAKTSKKSFTINWDGSYIDYDFASKTSIMGIILLEVQSAKELPRVKNCEFASLFWLRFLLKLRGTIHSDSYQFRYGPIRCYQV